MKAPDPLEYSCKKLKNQILNIREISIALGAQRCTTLPLWVAITGFVSTSSLRGRSKKTAFSAWNIDTVPVDNDGMGHSVLE